MQVNNCKTDSANRMLSLLSELSQLPRMINSPGLDKAFKIIKEAFPQMVIHEYPSGMECEDWIVPQSWAVKEGYMKDRAGNLIASTRESLLFVAPYSEPIDGWFSKEEISSHLLTRKDRPNAFALEHRNAYNYQLVDWGISLPYNTWIDLPEGEYHIKIDVDKGAGSMKVAEYFIPGRRPETLCICAHIDELCNDDLSGCVVALELIRSIENIPDRQYSYQILLVPEMFGSLFFVYNNASKIQNTVGMLNIESVGAGEEWCLKNSLQGNNRIDNLLRTTFNETGTAFSEIGFFEGYGNDEYVYVWPNINIPGVSIQRYPFDEYHTSDDTPDIINEDYLVQAVGICEEFVNLLEKDYIPYLKGRLQPWLTKRGLYSDCTDKTSAFRRFKNELLLNINGKRSILDLASLAGLEFAQAFEYLESFYKDNLLKKLDIAWIRPSETLSNSEEE